MSNNHGFTPGFIARTLQSQRDAFDWRFYVAVKALREIDPDFEAWYDGRPETTKGAMLPLMEERISMLKSQEVPA
jgi:acyl transferase domain-containing protein